MRGAQALGNLLADPHHFVDRQPHARLPVHIKRLALQERHGDKGNAVLLADFIDGANEGTFDTGGGACFAQETLAMLRVPGVLRLHNLERDVAFELDILGLVDRQHAALAEFAQDAIIAQAPELSHDSTPMGGHWPRGPYSFSFFGAFAASRTVRVKVPVPESEVARMR
jgi:hypothetical protein